MQLKQNFEGEKLKMLKQNLKKIQTKERSKRKAHAQQM